MKNCFELLLSKRRNLFLKGILTCTELEFFRITDDTYCSSWTNVNAKNLPKQFCTNQNGLIY